MSKDKVFFWMKTYIDYLLKSDEMFIILRQKNGASYHLLYEMLVAISINTNGRLEKSVGSILVPLDVNDIVAILPFNYFDFDTVMVGLELLKKLNLIKDEEGVIIISDFSRHVGSETHYANQKRLQRERKKELGGQVVDIVHLEYRDKSIDQRVEILDDKEPKSIDQNDLKEKKEKNNKVTIRSDSEVKEILEKVRINEWLIMFSTAHIFTKYLVYSRYLEEGNLDQLISANAFFETYLETTYEFDELKRHVQYFLYQYRKLKSIDKKRIKNKLGYLTNAIKNNQEAKEWLDSDEFKQLRNIHEIIDEKLRTNAEAIFPNHPVKQELFYKERYWDYYHEESRRIRKSFEMHCTVRY